MSPNAFSEIQKPSVTVLACGICKLALRPRWLEETLELCSTGLN